MNTSSRRPQLLIIAAVLLCHTACIQAPAPVTAPSADLGGDPDMQAVDMAEDVVAPSLATAYLRGDPHVITFDGRYFDFQAVGDFVLATSNAGAPLMVQIRQKKWDSPWCESVAVVDAVAAQVGGRRVTFHRGGEVLIDGEQIEAPTPLAVGELTALGEGEWALVWPDRTRLEVALAGQHIDVALSVPIARRGEISGIIGTHDGDAENELVVRDGEALVRPERWLDFYGVWANSWRVREGEAIIDELSDSQEEPDVDEDFPRLQAFPVGVTPEQEVDARLKCAEAGVQGDVLREACALDMMCTGEEEFLGALVGIEPPLPIELAKPGYLSECVETFEACVRVGCAKRADELADGQDSPDDGALTYVCPADCDIYDEWGAAGIDIYTDDSSICTSAIHAGAVDLAGGLVTFWMAPGQLIYPGSSRNGVRTEAWNQPWTRSFVFSPEYDCGDGVDNDLDGNTDCEDSACAEAVECLGQ